MKSFKPLALVAAVAVSLTLAAGMVRADPRQGPPQPGPGMQHKPGDWGPHHGHRFCGRPGYSPGHHWHGPHGMFNPNRMAMKLAGMETAIGIRSDQLDTWRDFTDALLAMMQPPMPPMPPQAGPNAGPGKAGPDKPGPGDAFSLAEHLADHAIDRAQKAEDLKKAIAELRTKLTPDQMARAQAYVDDMRHHWVGRWGHRGPGCWGRPGPHRMGPARMGPMGQQGPGPMDSDGPGGGDTPPPPPPPAAQ